MVFTSLPCYLDPPQWHQQPNHQLGITTTTSTNENHPQLQLPPPVTVPQSSTGSIRPNSMTDRARLAKIPQPESALKCPRCESTNTKFCYFNNYSLTQPRHFCKTCRRYWTRGGALRSVPVGGGCRRNKRSKGSSSKSSGNANHKGGGGTSNSATSTSTNTTNSLSSNAFTSDIVSNFASPLLPQLNFMNSLQHLHGYGDHMGLSFSATQQPLLQGTSMEFQMGTSTTTSGVGVGGGVDGSNILSDQWRLQQFPFLGGATYTLEGDMVSPTYSKTTPVVVKMEDNQGYNSTRRFLGIHGNDQYWGGIHGLSGGVGGSGSGGDNTGGDNAWTDLPSFTSSTTISHHLS